MKTLILIHGAGTILPYLSGKWLMEKFKQRLIKTGFPKHKLFMLNPNVRDVDLYNLITRFDKPHVIGHSHGGIRAHSIIKNDYDNDYTENKIVSKLFLVDAKTLSDIPPEGAEQTYNIWIRSLTVLGRNLREYNDPAINIRFPWKNHFNILNASFNFIWSNIQG